MVAEDNNNNQNTQGQGSDVTKAAQEAVGQTSKSPKKENLEDYDKELEKENKFYSMPTEKSVSQAGGGNNHKMVGVVIMICGVIILGGAVYFSYAYFIAPGGVSQATEDQQDQQQLAQQQEEQQGQQDKDTPASTGTSSEEEKQDQQQEQKDQDQTSEEEEKEQDKKDQDQTAQEGEDKEDEEGDSQEEQPSEEEEEEEKEATSTTPQVAAKDEDEDGLSNKEENIFGSEVDNQDTDGDGYKDGEEVLNLYSPTQEEKKIDKNENIASYTNDKHNYSLLYPKEWTKREVGGDRSLMFKSEGREFVQVIVQDNKDGQNIEEWFSKQFPEEKIKEENVVETETWKGIKKEGKSIYYITDKEKQNIYVLSYAAPSNTTPHYGYIFKMMVKSFEIGG